MPEIDFDPTTVPWIDRPDFSAELVRRLEAGELTAEEAEHLENFARDGFLYLPGAIATSEIDRLLEEVEEAWRDRPAIKALVEGRGVVPLAEVPARSELDTHHFRLLDFQDVSDAARTLMLHPKVTRYLGLIFGEEPVAMQSLYFEYGSEQGTHQDFPYVQAQILSHLVGCWIACEDVTAENGPLFYYRGSHRIPKFSFGGSLTYGGEDESQIAEFEAHLERECEEGGLEKLIFHAKKGDVLFWHSALVHGGSPARERDARRRSLVAHYSTRTAYSRDRRRPHEEPGILRRHGGVIYLRREPGFLDWLRSTAGGALRRLRS